MIELQGLKQVYDQESIAYPDWKIGKGESALILGQSGSGKTTLLHMIAGILKPSNGDLLIDDVNLAKLSNSRIDDYRRENIGIIFQKPHLMKSLNVRQNLLIQAAFSKDQFHEDRIKFVMESLQILDLTDRMPYELSEGQAQRVSIGRAIMGAPKIITADEPTASLDDDNCQRVIDLLQVLAKEGESTLVIATHDQRIKDRFETKLEL